MSLKDIMRDDLSIFFDIDDGFAQEIEYNGVKIPAIVDIGQTGQSGNDFFKNGSSDVATITVKRSDVSTVNKTQDKAVFEGATWRVSKIVTSDELTHQIEMSSNNSPYPRRS